MKSLKIHYYNAFMILTIMIAIGFLFYTNKQAILLETKVNEINRQISYERNTITILEKEWNYLTVPDRILRKANQVLPYLQTPNPNQIVSLPNLEKTLVALTLATKKNGTKK